MSKGHLMLQGASLWGNHSDPARWMLVPSLPLCGLLPTELELFGSCLNNQLEPEGQGCPFVISLGLCAQEKTPLG